MRAVVAPAHDPVPVVEPVAPPPAPIAEIDWATLCRPAPLHPQRPSVVHRWTDAAGVLHYSSAAPPSEAFDTARIEAKVPIGALIVVEGLDAPLLPAVREEMQADVLALLAAMGRELGIELDRTMRIDALVVSDPDTFAALRGEMLPSQSNIGGFYSPAERRLVVLRAARAQATRAMLRHEAVHAILHETLGNLPMWLNEGLAEYFERLDAQRGTARVSVGVVPEWVAVLRDRPVEERVDVLDRALSAQHADFHGEQQHAMYAASWAMVRYLMADASGRARLRALIDEQRRTPACRPADLRLALDRLAPERLDGFLAAVARWVDADPHAPQQL